MIGVADVTVSLPETENARILFNLQKTEGERSACPAIINSSFKVV